MSLSRNRNLLIIIAVLLLTNVGVLVYFLGQKKSGRHVSSDRGYPTVTEMLQKEVGFTDEQTVKYKEMKDKQKQKIRPMYDSMRKAKDSLFKLLSYPGTPDSLITKTAEVIAQKQKEIDLETFYHFKRVRTLCTPEQYANYDSMVLRMFRKMGKQPRQSEAHKK